MFRIDRREWRLIAMILAIKVLIFVFGAQSYAVLTNSAITNAPRGWFEIWNRWDAPHYLQLAEQGYKATGEDRLLLVFYPLYPWVIRRFAFVFGGSYVWSAFFVSGVASFLERVDYCLVAAVSRSFRQPVCRRIVGVLKIQDFNS